MDNIPITLLLALIGAIWAAFNVLITTQKQLSGYVDQIIGIAEEIATLAKDGDLA